MSNPACKRIDSMLLRHTLGPVVVLTGLLASVGCQEIQTDDLAEEQSSFLLGGTYTASTTNGTNTPAKAFDADTTSSRCESVHGHDPQWLQVDFGSTKSVSGVTFYWNNSRALDYQLQMSNDGTTWTTIRSVVNSPAGMDVQNGLSGSGRYM